MSTFTYADFALALLGGGVAFASQYLPRWRPGSHYKTHSKSRRLGSRRHRRSVITTHHAKPTRNREQDIAKIWPELPYLVQVFLDNNIAAKPQTPAKKASLGVLYVSQAVRKTSEHQTPA